MQGYFIWSVVLAFLADNKAHAESLSCAIVGKRFVSQQAKAVFVIPVQVGLCALAVSQLGGASSEESNAYIK